MANTRDVNGMSGAVSIVRRGFRVFCVRVRVPVVCLSYTVISHRVIVFLFQNHETMLAVTNKRRKPALLVEREYRGSNRFSRLSRSIENVSITQQIYDRHRTVRSCSVAQNRGTIDVGLRCGVPD
ncbi:uncharacterized protein LOC143152301 [Ptiloglossa arizonensis]|uniref:uncharacterized protein LOC143152301 n=1 Tax=Ptiloglossa arizonensis TaxID=3350558 RepID=UPI003FA10AF2